jgi:choice-of-anchor B domain-containing protein
MAGSFPCNGFDLQSRISLAEFGSSFGNDSWGWTDPLDGKEYALMGLGDGTAFVDISDPINPVFLGKLPTQTSSSFWRDIKVYENHAFIVSEANGHGMQVFDLTRLRSVASPPANFNADALYTGFGSAHNLIINEDTGYAYGVGTNTFNGGPHIVNIQDPVNPIFEGGFSFTQYCHDAQVITYNGPDTDYTGREILFGSNENEVVIVDVTDKFNPVSISSISYSNVAYTHQGWFTEDQRYFIVGDEVDEINIGFNTKTIIFDFNDLDNPAFSFNYTGPTSASDHNGYVVGNTYYMASYRAGMRALDITNISSQDISEIGYFDTHPESNSVNTNNGAWNVYPFFASGNLIVSDEDRGLFLIKSSSLGVNEADDLGFSLYPNPSNNNLTIKSINDPLTAVEVFNVSGQRVLDFKFSGTNSETIDVSVLTSGIYLVRINDSTTKRLIVK